jgi:hypothetical protein
MKEMVLAKAKVTTATEAGTFSAIISTVRPDREGDVVLPEAVVDALQAWGTKSIPLAWQHRAEDPDDIVGHIVPGSVKAIDGERMGRPRHTTTRQTGLALGEVQHPRL